MRISDWSSDVCSSDLIINLLVYFGWLTLFFLREARRFIAFIGQVVETMVIEVRHPGRLRYTSMVYHMEETGLRAIPIVGLLSFLIGMVMAYQGASQLQKFGAEIFVVDLIGIRSEEHTSELQSLMR